MSTRQSLTTLVLAALAEVTLLGVFVFVGELQRLGGPVPRVTLADTVYIAVALSLLAAAAVLPLRALLRRRRERFGY